MHDVDVWGAPLPPPPDRTRYYTTEQVADRLHVSPGAVRAMHTRGTGPPSIRRGRRRLYPADQFHHWLRTGQDTP